MEDYSPFLTGNEDVVYGFLDSLQTLDDKSSNANDATAGTDPGADSNDPTPVSGEGWDFVRANAEAAIIDSLITYNSGTAWEVIFAVTPDSFGTFNVFSSYASGDEWRISFTNSTTIAVRAGNTSPSFTVPTMTLGNTYVFALRKDSSDNLSAKLLGNSWTSSQSISGEFFFFKGIGNTQIPNTINRGMDGSIHFFRASSGDSEASIDTQMDEVACLLEARGLTVQGSPGCGTAVNSSRSAEVHGSVNVNATRDAEVHGIDTTTNERDAQVTGSVSDDDSRAAEVTGVYSWQIQRNDDGAGWNNIEAEIQIDEVTGEYTYTDTGPFTDGVEYCYRVKNLPDDSNFSNEDCVTFDSPSTDTSDTRTAEVHGQASANNTRDAEIHGQDTDDDVRSAEVTGQDTANDSRSAEVFGLDTDSDTRSAEIHGQDSLTNERNAEVHGVDTDNSERSAETRGQNQDNDTRSAEVYGIDTSEEERPAQIHGQDTDSDTRDAEITGVLGDNDVREAQVHGEASESDTRAAETHGEILDTSERSAQVHGIDTDNDSRSAEVHGELTVNSERNAEIVGALETDSERDSQIHGQASSQDTRNAEVYGIDTDNDSRSAAIRGKDITGSARSAKVTGAGKISSGKPDSILLNKRQETVLSSKRENIHHLTTKENTTVL